MLQLPADAVTPTATGAVHFLPPQMRTLSRDRVPMLWAWPAAAWAPIERRVDELITAAAMILAAIELHDRPLTVVS